jgi:hypothetical protein
MTRYVIFSDLLHREDGVSRSATAAGSISAGSIGSFLAIMEQTA